MFFKFLQTIYRPKRIYLDYASSTPVDHAMMDTLPKIDTSILGANPHALHREGVQARAVLERARVQVAKVLRAHSDEIIFTSGATESDNLALIGSIESALQKNIQPHEIAIITSDLEHAAVLETISLYKDRGVCIVTLPTSDGVVNPKDILVPEGIKYVILSIMYVNNEIGTVQPIREIAKRVRYLRKQYPEITFVLHTDATQAPAHFSLDTAALGVDIMTLGATKLYTSRGVGVLYKKRKLSLVPVMYGGGQEYGLRPGTESVEAIHVFAHALKHATDIQDEETKRVQELQKYFEEQLAVHIPQAIITAATLERTPHITHIALEGFDSELLVIELDARDIAVSAKSACKNEDSNESAIVKKLYGQGYGAVRFSFGRTTSKGGIDTAVKALDQVIQKYRTR